MQDDNAWDLSKDELVDAARITCRHMQRFTEVTFTIDPTIQLEAIPCKITTALIFATNRVEICYDTMLCYKGDVSDYSPTMEDLNNVLFVALMSPSVDDLLVDLTTSLNSTNPLSTTTLVEMRLE